MIKGGEGVSGGEAVGGGGGKQTLWLAQEVTQRRCSRPSSTRVRGAQRIAEPTDCKEIPASLAGAP